MLSKDVALGECIDSFVFRFIIVYNVVLCVAWFAQAFKKDDRVRLERKELFKNTLRKASHAWKRIIELRLTGAIIVSTTFFFHPFDSMLV